MKKTRPILVFATSLLLLCACTEPVTTLDSSIESTSTSEPANTDKPVSTGTSEEKTPIQTDTPVPPPPTPTTSATPEVPVERSITLHKDANSAGITIKAPATALSGSTVTLEVSVEAQHILEYIRLHAPTAQEGGVRVKADANGAYSFVMPNQDLNIYYKGVIGYSVNFASDHATAVLAEDSAPYDLFGEGYPVYVKKSSVDPNYGFSGFTVKDASGNDIPTWNDRIDQIGFKMPASEVTVTAHAVPIDQAFVPIAGTYAGGLQVDLNEPSNAFELQVDVNGRITFKSDWTDPYWTGIATYDGTTLEADLTHLTQDGYYGKDVRHFKAVFTTDHKFFSAEFSSGGTSPVIYHYVFGKASERIQAKKLYRSDFIGGDYSKAERVYSVSAASGDFFTYVNAERTEAHYFLHAFEFGSSTEVYSFLANKKYALKDASGRTVLTLSYNGALIEVGGKEAGTYTLQGQPDLVLDGFGNYTLGTENGTYAVQGDKVTLSTGNKTVTIDGNTHTYSLEQKPVEPVAPAYPFSSKKYGTSLKSPIKFGGYDNFGEYLMSSYQLQITFGAGQGEITAIDLICLDKDGWSTPLGSEWHSTSNLSYQYDETTAILTASLDGRTAKIAYNASTDALLYKGVLWHCDQGEQQINAKDQTLTVIQ